MARKGRRSNTRRPKRPAITRKRVRSVVEGKHIRLSPDPPNFTAAPWWPITVVATISTVESFKPSTVTTALKAQLTGLALATNASFYYRFLSVRAWSKADLLNLVIGPALGENNVALHDMFDYASKMNFARIGFRLGDLSSQKVFSQSDSTSVLFDVDVPGNGTAIVYIEVLIRFQAKSLARILHAGVPSLENMALN